jgi:MoxR-like ATPase
LPEPAVISLDDIVQARSAITDVTVSDIVESYIVQLINATRRPGDYNTALSDFILFGASPRATISIDRCARALAWLNGDDFVTPEHVQRVAKRVIGHRLVLSLQAQAQGMTGEQVVEELLKTVPIV